MNTLKKLLHSILLGYGQFLCSVFGFTTVLPAIGIILAIVIPNFRKSSSPGNDLAFVFLFVSLIIVFHSYCIILAMKNNRSDNRTIAPSQPFLISRNGPEIFVSFQKPITEWTQIDMDNYQNQLHEEIKATLSVDDYKTFQERENLPEKYEDLLFRIRNEISEYYHVKNDEIILAKYHGNQTAFLLNARCIIKSPYLFRGFQIRIETDEEQKMA